jgi:dienelactone hydrolase
MRYEAALSSYRKSSFTSGPWTRDVYRRGSGPAVIVIHEAPGIIPEVIRFADRVAEAGMTVFLPSLFGEPGRPMSGLYAIKSVAGLICVRREFNLWATGKSSPIVAWLNALAREAGGECGGNGVGAVGMCVTGGFALAMMMEPKVVAPVVAEPSLPIALGSKARAADLGASVEEIACAKARFVAENLSMVGLRFKGDPAVPEARFEAYRRQFGDRFEGIELDKADAAPSGQSPHSVLTLHMRETGPTKAAEQRVIAFLKERTGAGRTFGRAET